MAPEVIEFRRARDPRRRLAVQPEPRPNAFIVMMRGAPQGAFVNLGEARAVAQAMALDHVGDPIQVLELKATFQTATVVREARP
ncbi:MAG: hypothetical protein P4L73_19100 [Caulobacteraceae bacterium]|nr:hypothetical protein [Caulobacteraceae bacterium]